VTEQDGVELLGLFGLAVNEQFKYDRFFQMMPSGPNARVDFSKGFIDLAMSMNPKPKTIALLWEHYRVSTIDDLERICQEQKLRLLPRLGANLEHVAGMDCNPCRLPPGRLGRHCGRRPRLRHFVSLRGLCLQQPDDQHNRQT